MDINYLNLSGRVTTIKFGTSRNDVEYCNIGMVINGRTISGKDTTTTFVTVMVFSNALIKYLKDLDVAKGQTIMVIGQLSNTNKNGFKNLSVIANNVVVSAKVDNDMPNTENAIINDYLDDEIMDF